MRPRLTVDRAALAANLGVIRDALGAGSAAGATVKADAYGLGLATVVPVLVSQGVRDFFVATAAEAQALLSLLASTDLNGAADGLSPRSCRCFVYEGVFDDTAAVLAESGAIPVLNDAWQAERWRSQAQTAGKVLLAAIHIDTGMRRLGFEPKQFERWLAAADNTATPAATGISFDLLMTHLACADEPDAPVNDAQVGRFETAVQAWIRHTGAVPRTSIGNSAAALSSTARQGDLVRPGIALYGGNPFDPAAVPGPSPVAAVATLDVPVLQVRQVEAAGSVGYGSRVELPAGATLATLAIGYADGVPRSLGSAARAEVAVCKDGQWCKAPLVGRVSMDMVTVDISGVPWTVQPGDRAQLFGPQVSIDSQARAAATIPYELLTGLGRRIERIVI